MTEDLVVVSAKFSRRDANLIEKIAQLRDESKSAFFRRSVSAELVRLGYCEERRKALGLLDDKERGSQE